jgi:hypothetical protein
MAIDFCCSVILSTCMIMSGGICSPASSLRAQPQTRRARARQELGNKQTLN